MYHSKKDKEIIKKIDKNNLNNVCDVEIIDHNKARKIKPGIVKQDCYLWSPKTAVFNPSLILKKLFILLKDEGVQFINEEVIEDDCNNKRLRLSNNSYIKYSRYINCAGAGALRIAKKITSKFDDLSIVPFLGEYGIQKRGLKINTNLYPVPDPPTIFRHSSYSRINNFTLIGPNAVPVIRKDTQGYDLKDLIELPSIVLNNFLLFALNKQNYREHAFSEISLNKKLKFLEKSLRYFSDDSKKEFEIDMDKMTYGIRPQLVNTKVYEFENDFLYEIINENIHIVNAVSPAFTSSFAFAEYILSLL